MSGCLGIQTVPHPSTVPLHFVSYLSQLGLPSLSGEQVDILPISVLTPYGLYLMKNLLATRFRGHHRGRKFDGFSDGKNVRFRGDFPGVPIFLIF